jgi:hypothetical protein
MATPMQIVGASPLQIVTNGAALTSGSTALFGPFLNVSGQPLGGYTAADLRLVFTMAAAPFAGSAIVVFTLNAQDPTQNANFEDGSAGSPGVIPTKTPVGILVMDTTQTSYNRSLCGPIVLPPGYFKILIWNNATGQTMAANWNAYLAPWTPGF